jgi:hypothetical protein
MTVTVTKSEINVRDTLTRLDAPQGVFGMQLDAANTVTEAYALMNPVMFRNRIINGDMRIDQRNAGNSVTTSALQQGIYTIDRWNYYNDVISKRTIQQSSVAPPGFKNSLKVTVIATDTSGPQQFLRHTIEGYNLADLNWGTSSAQPAVLSFWVRSSIVGQHGGAIQSSNTDWCLPIAYYITAVDTWEYKTIQITGPTTGSWGSTNGYGAAIQFEHGVGYQKSPANVWIALNATSSTGSVNLCATNGATWYITGVQFEKGTQATPFEFRPFGLELFLCERYYQKTYPVTTAPGTSQGDFDGMVGRTGMQGVTASSAAAEIFLSTLFRQKLRASPSVKVYDRAGTVDKVTGTNYAVNDYNNNSVSYRHVNLTGFGISSSGNAQVMGSISYHYTADAEI